MFVLSLSWQLMVFHKQEKVGAKKAPFCLTRYCRSARIGVSGLQRYSGWDWTSVVLSGSSTANALFSPNAVKVAFRGNGMCVTNLALVLRVQYSAGVAPHSPCEAARQQPLAA